MNAQQIYEAILGSISQVCATHREKNSSPALVMDRKLLDEMARNSAQMVISVDDLVSYDQAAKVAREVRDFVRDRFTPGTLSSLNELESMVTEKILKIKEES